jgi:hypothetical protein
MKFEFHKIIFTSYSEVILSFRVSGRKNLIRIGAIFAFNLHES